MLNYQRVSCLRSVGCEKRQTSYSTLVSSVYLGCWPLHVGRSFCLSNQMTFFEWPPPTDIPSGIYSDIPSGIVSGLYSDIPSGILSEIHWNTLWHYFGHIIWHLFWHSIWHSFCHSIGHLFWHFFLDLSGIYSDILSGMCSGPGAAHCIQHLRYRVRVQAWPTASRARDMARIRWCPQSRQGVDEERRKEGGKEWVGVSRSEWVRPGPYLAGGNNVRANWLEPKWQSFVGRRVSNLWPMPIFDDKHPHCVVCYMKTSFFILFMPNLGLLCIVRIIYQNPHMLN